MTFRELSPELLEKLKDPLIVDVRSPCEHIIENIPGSTNIPLLSDDERAKVGTIYKQQGEVIARRQALRIISPKISDIIDAILNVRRQGQAIVVQCWRGGLRSEAVASFLSVVGIDCWRLTGGYKSWRRLVISDLQKADYPFTPVILQGLTGVGKTDILKHLRGLGLMVLDLEHLANHRGSVFGGMGLGEQPTQKNFEAALWNELKLFGRRTVFLEAESRKIGKLSLPDFIIDRIAGGRKVLVTGSLDARAQRIMDDYGRALATANGANPDQALCILGSLKERLGAKRVQEIEEMARSGDLLATVRKLLVEYYDPLYQRQLHEEKCFQLEVSGDDPAKAASELFNWCARTAADGLSASPSAS